MRTIRGRLQLSIGSLVLVIIAFNVVYFPMQQRSREIASFEAQLKAVGDSIAIGISVALEGRSYQGMKQASDYVKGDPDLVSVVITTVGGEVFAAYPPEAGKEAATGVEGRDYLSYRAPLSVGGREDVSHYVTLTRSLERLDHRILRSQLRILGIGAAIFLTALAVIHQIARSVAGPIELLSSAVTKVGQGKLSTRVETSRRDEFGTLATGFNSMIESLQDLALSVREGMEEVQEVAGSLEEAAAGMVADLERQQSATGTVAEATMQVSQTAKAANANADRLAGSIHEASAALFEMDTATQTVATNMDGLIGALDTASSGATEMASSGDEIARAMEALRDSTDEAEHLLRRMADSLRGMSDNASSCGGASEEVVDEAALGNRLVDNTVDSIREVEKTFAEIQQGVSSLETKTNAVGGILELISEITDETNLLALNASIIAAQNDRGGAFAVVAREIKVLSHRTASSAQNVAKIIEEVRAQAMTTSEAVAQGVAAVGKVLEDSSEAGSSLRRITEKARGSAERITEITRAAGTQARDIEEVEAAMSKVHGLTAQTSAATHQQSQVGFSVSSGLEQIRGLGLEIHRASREQREQSSQVTRSVEEISSEMGEIVQASATQVAECDSVTATLSVFRETSQVGEQRAETCREIVEKLIDRARRLRGAVDRLEV